MNEFNLSHSGYFYRHYHNGHTYETIGRVSIQENNIWVDAVAYILVGETKIFVRSAKEFKEKFNLVNTK